METTGKATPPAPPPPAGTAKPPPPYVCIVWGMGVVYMCGMCVCVRINLEGGSPVPTQCQPPWCLPSLRSSYIFFPLIDLPRWLAPSCWVSATRLISVSGPCHTEPIHTQYLLIAWRANEEQAHTLTGNSRQHVSQTSQHPQQPLKKTSYRSHIRTKAKVQYSRPGNRDRLPLPPYLWWIKKTALQ